MSLWIRIAKASQVVRGKLQQVTCLFLGRLGLQPLHHSSPAPPLSAGCPAQMQSRHRTLAVPFSQSHHDWYLVTCFKVQDVQSNLMLASTCFATSLFDLSGFATQMYVFCPAWVHWIFFLLIKFSFDPSLARSTSTETKEKPCALSLL